MLLTMIHSHNQKSLIHLKDTEGQELEKRIIDATRELEEMKDDVSNVNCIEYSGTFHCS